MATSAPASGRRRGLTKLRRREAFEGFAYISPWLLGFICFVLGPTLASLALSFSKYNVVSPPSFVGLRNYRVIFFSRHTLFWHSLSRTLYYASLSVPLGIIGSLLCAALLNQKRLGGRVTYRVLFYLPSLTPVVASAVLWSWILQPEVGPLNFFLSKLGIQGPKWLASIEWAIPALIIIAVWASVGGNRMVIFLAGLQGIPQELYEAAAIDGAGAWHKFRHVTLPMLTPVIYFNLIVGVIGALKVFAVAFVATQGGPAQATYFYVLYLFDQAFTYFEMGLASALAWIFLLVVLCFTLLQVKLSGRWVFYAGEVA